MIAIVCSQVVAPPVGDHNGQQLSVLRKADQFALWPEPWCFRCGRRIFRDDCDGSGNDKQRRNASCHCRLSQQTSSTLRMRSQSLNAASHSGLIQPDIAAVGDHAEALVEQ